MFIEELKRQIVPCIEGADVPFILCEVSVGIVQCEYVTECLGSYLSPSCVTVMYLYILFPFVGLHPLCMYVCTYLCVAVLS